MIAVLRTADGKGCLELCEEHPPGRDRDGGGGPGASVLDIVGLERARQHIERQPHRPRSGRRSRAPAGGRTHRLALTVRGHTIDVAATSPPPTSTGTRHPRLGDAPNAIIRAVHAGKHVLAMFPVPVAPPDRSALRSGPLVGRGALSGSVTADHRGHVGATSRVPDRIRGRLGLHRGQRGRSAGSGTRGRPTGWVSWRSSPSSGSPYSADDTWPGYRGQRGTRG